MVGCGGFWLGGLWWFVGGWVVVVCGWVGCGGLWLGGLWWMIWWNEVR